MTLLLRRTLLLLGVSVLLAVAALGAARAAAPPPPMSANSAILAAPSATPGEPAGGTTDGTIPATDPAAGLDSALGSDLDAILAADQTSSRPTAAAGRLRRLAAWQRLVHATVVVDLKKGGLTTIQIDHGTISAVSAASLTIKETGGGSVTVVLGAESRVRRDGAKATIADLRTSDDVFVLSKVDTSGATAYLVVVPRT